MKKTASSLSTDRVAQDIALDDGQPCPDPRCNDTLGAMPIPQCVTAVAWAEEAARVADALRGILNVIEVDELIPESVSYMRQAREVMKDWPEIPELPVPPFPITQAGASASALSTIVPDHSQASLPESESISARSEDQVEDKKLG